MRRHLLVTGIIRSGSTYVGNVLEKVDGLYYMQEPFNKGRGLVDVHHWFPYAHGPGHYYARVVDQFMECKFAYKNVPSDSVALNFVKKAIGSGTSLRAKYYKYWSKRYAGMLIKDPLAAFLSRYMHVQHSVPVIVLVRHPMAFFYSYKRLGWKFDFTHFLSQEELIEAHLSEEIHLMERSNLSFPQQVGLLWRCVYKVLSSFEKEFEDDSTWIVKRHEDICRAPLEEFTSMLKPLSFELNDAARTFILQTTKIGNPVNAPKNDIHVLQRDSNQLVDYWMAKVSAQEVSEVRAVTEDVAYRYYDVKVWRDVESICAA